MKLYLLSGLIISFLLHGCSYFDKQTTDDNLLNRAIFPEIKSSDLFKQLCPTIQNFQITVNSDTLISGKNGTKIFIPQNSFTDKKGKKITGIINIEIIEVLSIAEVVRCNLQTVSYGDIMSTEGMLFINAKDENSNPVLLNKAKTLDIALPNITHETGPQVTQLCSGSYDTIGVINWNKMSEMKRQIIPLPLDMFDYNYKTSFGFERSETGEGQMTFTDEIYDSVTLYQPHLQNTFIATREFEERLKYINAAEWTIGHYHTYYTNTKKAGTILKDSTITNIYLNNLDKDLWYSDSLAYVYLNNLQNSIKFTNHWYSDKIPVNLVDVFNNFYKQRLTKVFSLQNIDLNLSYKITRTQLSEQGLNETETDILLGAYLQQQEIIKSRSKENGKNIKVFSNFKISNLGWINIAAFNHLSNGIKTNISATINNYTQFPFVSTLLIINNRLITCGGTPNESGFLTFNGITQSTLLPDNESAVIIAISQKDDTPYLAMNFIEISEGTENFNLELHTASINEIYDYLNELN